jgi:hypothetical protein
MPQQYLTARQDMALQPRLSRVLSAIRTQVTDIISTAVVVHLRLPSLANLNSAGIQAYSSDPPKHHNLAIPMG